MEVGTFTGGKIEAELTSPKATRLRLEVRLSNDDAFGAKADWQSRTMWLPNDTGYFLFLVVAMASCTGFIAHRAPTKWVLVPTLSNEWVAALAFPPGIPHPPYSWLHRVLSYIITLCAQGLNTP